MAEVCRAYLARNVIYFFQFHLAQYRHGMASFKSIHAVDSTLNTTWPYPCAIIIEQKCHVTDSPVIIFLSANGICEGPERTRSDF